MKTIKDEKRSRKGKTTEKGEKSEESEKIGDETTIVREMKKKDEKNYKRTVKTI